MQRGSGDSRPTGPRHGRNWARLVGDALLLAGVLSLLLAAYAYFTDPSRSDLSLPRPVALAGEPEVSLAEATPLPVETPAPTPIPPSPEPTRPQSTPRPSPTPTATPVPSPTPIPSGAPIRMVIPSIKMDSEVEDIGTTLQDGKLIWETIPFIVGHYRTSAKAGAKGNAIFSGHVASRNWGNVFINLYKVKLGDEILIHTDEAVFTYTVSRIRLVLPTQTEVMDQTPDATITVITCGGDWLADQRDYSHRLVVSAKLKSAEAN